MSQDMLAIRASGCTSIAGGRGAPIWIQWRVWSLQEYVHIIIEYACVYQYNIPLNLPANNISAGSL